MSENDTPCLDEALPQNVPQHVAMIMDGNGRWAKSRGLPRRAGHEAGTENLRHIIRACVEFNVKILTIYAFSTENWRRPRWEITALMHILENVIDKELDELKAEGVQLRHLGTLERLPGKIKNKVLQAIEETRHNDRLIVNVAFNYGGRDEIVHAMQHMLQDGIKPEDITEDMVSNYLYTAGMPDPDLIIRTSGEHRLSNFLIWQGAYSEHYYTNTLWPDFGRDAFKEALMTFCQRDRRFGALEAEAKKS